MVVRLFIHIPKNGGMSIRRGLRDQIVNTDRAGAMVSPEYARRLTARMDADGEHYGYAHARWRDLRSDLRLLPAFALVRNPWSRVVSRYFFSLQSVRLGKPHAHQYESFEHFLGERHAFGQREFYWHRGIRGWYQQKGHVTDEAGNLRCDILRTEHLDEDVEAYLGHRPPRRRNVTTGNRPYQDLYTPETRQIVAEWYAEDIEFFGFQFQGPATRNLWDGI